MRLMPLGPAGLWCKSRSVRAAGTIRWPRTFGSITWPKRPSDEWSDKNAEEYHRTCRLPGGQAYHSIFAVRHKGGERAPGGRLPLRRLAEERAGAYELACHRLLRAAGRHDRAVE